MSTIGAYEAKTHLPRLLEQVERGEIVTITKHGRVVARLVPARAVSNETVDDLVEAARRERAGRLLGSSVRDAIAEGRR